MADAVATQTLLEDRYILIQKFTNVSDGTGEAAVKKVDVSALTPAATRVTIKRIWYSNLGMSVQLFWDATTDVFIIQLPADESGYLDFEKIGGLPNTAATGYTGDIMFTTVGHTAADTYTIVLEMKKHGTISS